MSKRLVGVRISEAAERDLRALSVLWGTNNGETIERVLQAVWLATPKKEREVVSELIALQDATPKW